MAVVNAWILYNKFLNDKPTSMREFKEQLIEKLILKSVQSKMPITSAHFLTKVPGLKREKSDVLGVMR